MKAPDKSDLFEFMLERVNETHREHLEDEPQAFGRWFAELFFMNPREVFISDGAKDGKIDLFFRDGQRQDRSSPRAEYQVHQAVQQSCAALFLSGDQILLAGI